VRIYAVTTSGRGEQALVELGYPWVLLAFGAGDPLELPYRPGLLLDSGAFSAWTIGRPVDVEAYALFARRVVDEYGEDVAVLNLDVIPGEPERRPTDRERRRAADESAGNAAALRDHGLDVIEVFHLFEPLPVFERMLERRRPHELVALGGMVYQLAKRSTVVRAFCDEAFSFARDWSGGWSELPPIHGLGVSGDSPTARRYPWWSVDSIAWMAKNPNLEVTGEGRFRHRGSHGRPRTTAASSLFAIRRLERWAREEAAITAMWDRRGVGFAYRVAA
jgi:hypothetical protein